MPISQLIVVSKQLNLSKFNLKKKVKKSLLKK